MLDDEIEITIVSIDGDQVKLGINAPKSVDIHRKEVYLSIQEANKAASTTELAAITQMKSLYSKKNSQNGGD